ncbi:hypothetical protein ACVR0Q_04460 [Streptococcus canis]|uniref:hypothetical protein n=1 Tax=Streptococcus canis TaxID=1329 RepID=UPI002F9654EF
MTSKQSALAQLTKNIMVVDLMKQTGWPRDRAIAAIEELENCQLVQFPHRGGMALRKNARIC